MQIRRQWRAVLPVGVVMLGAALVPATGVLAAGTASAAASVAAAPAVHAAQGGTWGTAAEVPGLGALNTGGEASIESVSCASAGDCGAGGSYPDRSGRFHAFVVSQSNGTWGAARQVTGSAGLFESNAAVNAVSCGTPGDCSAAGDYTGADGHDYGQVFVVNQVNGAWGTAEQIPGTAALNTGDQADVTGLSCASAGNCGAVGTYKSCPKLTGCLRAFVADEVNGTWGQAKEVPGMAAHDAQGGASGLSISCVSAGNCTASGSFGTRLGGEAFVVTETNGTWGKAIEVPGIAALNTGKDARAKTISCASAGNCSVGGFYTDSSTDSGLPFVATETNGTWGRAIEVPGVASSAEGETLSVSCGSEGSCTAGGDYGQRAWAATLKNGVWGKSIEVPGLRALGKGRGTDLLSVSCSGAGDCSAGGVYTDSSFNFQAWVASEANGTWSNAIEVPGTAALNTGESAGVTSVSCGAPDNCAAVGTYTEEPNGVARIQSFVANQS